MRAVININFDQLLYRLLCAYAFLIPFEKILEVLFNIDTIFKPYRILGIVVVFLFLLKCVYKWKSNSELKRDIFLYSIFLYGLLITSIKMITTSFSTSLFYNDVFQLGLYLAILVVIRHTDLNITKLLSISKCLALGILVNGSYIMYNFFVLKNYRRETGFMDNPNYLAFSIVIAVLLLLALKSDYTSKRKKISWWLILIFMSYVFIIAGSRTATVVLVIASTVQLYLSPLRQKRIIIGAALSITILIGIRTAYISEGLAPRILLNRITKKKTSDDPRIPMWTGIIQASQETNFIGLGIGQFKANFHKYYHDENNELIQRIISRGYFLSPHSDYFALLIVYGMFGLCCYLIFELLVYSQLLVKHRLSRDESEQSYYRYSISIFVALAVFGLGAENFNSPLYWIVLSLSTNTEFS